MIQSHLILVGGMEGELLGIYQVQSQVGTRPRVSLSECGERRLQGKETLVIGDGEKLLARLHLSFLLLYPFLMQWPHQSVKPLNSKSEAYLFICFFLPCHPI